MHGPIGPGLKPWTCIHVCMYVHFMNVRDQNELAREREGGGGREKKKKKEEEEQRTRRELHHHQASQPPNANQDTSDFTDLSRTQAISSPHRTTQSTPKFACILPLAPCYYGVAAVMTGLHDAHSSQLAQCTPPTDHRRDSQSTSLLIRTS